MKRQKMNAQKSNKRFAKNANRTHRLNKAPAASFLRRGGIRL